MTLRTSATRPRQQWLTLIAGILASSTFPCRARKTSALSPSREIRCYVCAPRRCPATRGWTNCEFIVDNRGECTIDRRHDHAHLRF